MDNRINGRRVAAIFGIVLVTMLLTFFFCSYEKFYLDEWLCFIFLDIIFLMIFVFEMEYGRSRYMISNNRNTNFMRILMGFVICCVITGLSVFLPAYAKPAMVFSIIMYAFSNEIIAIASGIYLSVILTLAIGGDYYELMGVVILVLFGTVVAQTLNKNKLKRMAYGLIFSINILIPTIFYYWGYKEYPDMILVYGLINGIVSSFVLYICDRYVRPETVDEAHNTLIDIIDDNYSEVIELKSFSNNEYTHARRVSDIAFVCAKKAGLDENLCAAAGFYYRFGKWLGEDYINLGVKRAQKLCFPEKLVIILEEYYGEVKKPSTPESALVHMVDVVIKKMDSINSEVSTSTWNSDMIVMQTVNELSQSGMYDQSGLGMNQFFLIRACLAKEVR